MRAAVKPYLALFALIFAGEAVFSLPFHVPRFFRPTMLETFDFSNTQLGDAFAAYGLVAMAAYFIGGPLADKYPPKTLLSLSLVATALGGLLFAQFPSAQTLSLLYAYWGATTVLLFWSPLIRATREWGGPLAQGQAFGLLDGGRGLMAAASASCAVIVFAWLLPDSASASTEHSRHALQKVIYLYTGITALAALMVWCLLPGQPPSGQQSVSTFINIKQVISKPVVWAHAGIIICAYCAYKGLDNYGVYCVEVLGLSQLEAAQFTSNAAYLRLFGALLAGLLADRIGASRTIVITFITLTVCYVFLSQATPDKVGTFVLYGNLLTTFFAAYAMRGIYYALLEEVNTPKHLTGTTVGLIAVLGYTPDVFYYSIAGRLLDFAPGLEGHQLHFTFLAGVMCLGLLLSFALIALNRKNSFAAIS